MLLLVIDNHFFVDQGDNAYGQRTITATSKENAQIVTDVGRAFVLKPDGSLVRNESSKIK